MVDLAVSMEVTVSELYEATKMAIGLGAWDIMSHRVIATVSEVEELEKEIRKSIWYWEPSVCRCAKCDPLN